MTLCVVASSLGSEWFYPVVDPYRTAGAGPYHYGYVFAWDAVDVTVTRKLSLPRCIMEVELSSTLPETKEIQAFNFSSNTWHAQIDSDPTGGVTSMVIEKWKEGEACSSGTDTVVIARPGQFGPVAYYTFGTVDFWDFWGGCTVRFDWVRDLSPIPGGLQFGPSGAQTPAPRYPAVRLPDGTLMRNAAGPGVSVVFGGTDFPADLSYLGLMGPETTAATADAVLERDRRNLLGAPNRIVGGAIDHVPLPALAADFTLVREWKSQDVYVVFGGAKFRIPDTPTLTALGFDLSMVRAIPAGGTSKLLTIPIDRTLLKEQHSQHIFVVEGQELRSVSPAVMEARCLPWRHVRVVPDGQLSNLPFGSDLDLP